MTLIKYTTMVRLVTLFILVISNVRTICATTIRDVVPNVSNEYDYSDYDYADYSPDTDFENTNSMGGTNASSSPVLNATVADPVDGIFQLIEKLQPPFGNDQATDKPATAPHPCPALCTCPDGTAHVDCSHRNLTAIPLRLPQNAITIDLTGNQIVTLRTDDFAECRQMRELLLAANQIEQIDPEVFATNIQLEHISLSSNRFTTINADTFTKAIGLRKLCLNKNHIVLPPAMVFLHLPQLRELNLNDCHLRTIDTETFANLTGLESLNLANNPLDESINVNAFKSLRHLRKLRLPKINSVDIKRLCEILTAIDNINTDIDVSCFELSAGLTFEESVHTTVVPLTSETDHGTAWVDLNRPSSDAPSDTISRVANQNHEKGGVDGGDIQEIITAAATTVAATPQSASETTTATRPTAANNTNVMTTKRMTTPTTTTAAAAAEAVATTANGSPANDHSTMDISSQSIHTILIAIIIIAVIGLAVGFIFRSDCCGIKTKLCRTRRRPPSTDQVRPAEEVPLNKV